MNTLNILRLSAPGCLTAAIAGYGSAKDVSKGDFSKAIRGCLDSQDGQIMAPMHQALHGQRAVAAAISPSVFSARISGHKHFSRCLILIAAMLLAGLPLAAQAADAIWQNGAWDPAVEMSGDGWTGYDPFNLGGGFRFYFNDSPNNNTVTVNDSSTSVDGYVYGGASTDANTNVSGNTVEIISGTVDGAVYGGYSRNGDATGNTVKVSGTVNSYIHGGYSVNADAIGNIVDISGGTVLGNVYGGYALYGGDGGDGGDDGDDGDDGDAINNTVKISGNPTFGSAVGGGFDGNTSNPGTSTGDLFSGNTLEFSSSASVTIPGTNYGSWFDTSLGNFEYYKFTLDPGLADGDPLIFAGKLIILGEIQGSKRPSKIQVTGIMPGQTLSQGNKFVLMEGNIYDGATMSPHDDDDWTIQGVPQQGTPWRYDMRVKISGTRVTATVTNVYLAPATAIPTLSEWGMILMIFLIAAFAFPAMRRRA